MRAVQPNFFLDLITTTNYYERAILTNVTSYVTVTTFRHVPTHQSMTNSPMRPLYRVTTVGPGAGSCTALHRTIGNTPSQAYNNDSTTVVNGEPYSEKERGRREKKMKKKGGKGRRGARLYAKLTVAKSSAYRQQGRSLSRATE